MKPREISLVQLTINQLINAGKLPAYGEFEVTEELIKLYLYTYKEVSNGSTFGTSSNYKFARRLAGLNLLKENLHRDISASKIKAGHIYLIGNLSFPYHYKVGVSYNCHTRLAQYQTYSPYRNFYLKKYDFVLDKFNAERQILNDPLVVRAGGEWLYKDFAIEVFTKVVEQNYSTLERW